MHRPSLSILLAATALVGACQPEPAEDTDAAQEPAVNRPVVPRPQPPLDRSALLSAVAEAASATAAGVEMPESVRALAGRQFEARIRFGCHGPTTELSERWLGWSFDPEARRIRVRAMPTISSDEPLARRINDDEFEAVEGFWIPRPWLLQPACPATAALRQAPDPGEQAAGGEGRTKEQAERLEAGTAAQATDRVGEPLPRAPRVGIAQFFTERDPRPRRRGVRPYEASHTLREGEAISSQGYNLVLSGRLRPVAGRGVIHCFARDPDSPPECVISAQFLRVWIEQPDTRGVIAEWGTG
jgi:hypothetical protein